MTWGTQLIFCTFDVNGDATDASASDNDIPTWAKHAYIYSYKLVFKIFNLLNANILPAFKAPQSLAPSPPREKYKNY